MKTLLSLVAFGLAGTFAPAFADNVPATPQASWSPSPGDQIHFDVLRKGSEFGTHVVRFSETEAGDLQVSVDVDLKAGLGPITLFRYSLDASETWRDGQLLSVEGRVNDDGTREAVTATRDGQQLQVSGDGFEGFVEASILPASHWNMAQTNAKQLLSTENGEVIDVVVSNEGRETLTIAGKQIETTRYLMDSDIDVTLWYDDQGRWMKLAFEARGQSIEYVLRDLY